jgi:hypothetical protein
MTAFAGEIRPDASWHREITCTGLKISCGHPGFLKSYTECTGDEQFPSIMISGYEYWKKTFSLPDGTPSYYNHQTLPSQFTND